MKRLLLFFSFLTVAFGVNADDGGVYNVEDWTYGNIYVKEPNDKIALEKELMVCGMDSITAVFVFKNTTDDTVNVDCAFPVDVKLPYTTDSKELDGISSCIENCYSVRVLQMLLGNRDTFDIREVIGKFGRIVLNERVKNLVLKHDKELRVMSWEDYSKYLSSLKPNKDKYGAEKFQPMGEIKCHIVQNGQSVDIRNVGIESTVSSNEIKMQFHFHHQLKFLPNAYSKVVVKYAVKSFKESDSHSYTESYSYDISTGGTWKGNIHSFVLATKNCRLENNTRDHFDVLNRDGWKGCIYSKREYKPHKDDYFDFSYVETDFDDYESPSYGKLRSVPLKDVRASSTWSNVEALTDKNQFTSCAITDWRNATVEFTLTEDAFGPSLCNGTSGKLVSMAHLKRFQDSLNSTYGAPVWVRCSENRSCSEFFPDDSSLMDNNWVRRIFFERLDRPSDTFSYFVDSLNPCHYPRTFEWERIDAVGGLDFFPAGRYRMSIKDCYPGMKSQDTAFITELWFCPVGNLWSMVEEDKSSRFPIFQHLKDYIDYQSWESESYSNDYESAPVPEPELFGKKKFQRAYRNALENTVEEAEEPQGISSRLWIAIISLLVLGTVVGIVYWKRKG